MELQDALVSHLDWKVRLRTALADRQSVNLDAASDHEHCALGQWLRGEASVRFGHLASYHACCDLRAVSSGSRTGGALHRRAA